MSTFEEAIDVDVPVRTAYNQWTQFETFPHFMDGVEQVVQETETLTHWVTAIGGVRREFDAEIVEQHPDDRVAWTTVGDGPRQSGEVIFHSLGDTQSRVVLRMTFDPSGLTESVGDAVGGVARRIRGDLAKFKAFIESRRRETGSWRGEVTPPPVD